MRILFIVTAFPRRPGDVITPWLTETITRLKGRGVEVEVLAPSYRGLGDHVHEGIRVHRFRYAPTPIETLTHDQTAPDRLREVPAYGLLVPGYLVAGSVRAAQLARSGRFDAIHCFWPLPHGLIGLAARSVSGVPVISTFFGVELTWLRRDLPFLAPVVRSIIRRSDAVTVISSHTATEVHRLVPDASIRTIPFGAAVQSVDTEYPTSPSEEERSDRAFQVLFVGRLVERKGLPVLLRALELLRQTEDVRLVIIGDGPLRAPLESEARQLGIAEAVEFTGFVADEELQTRFARADVFVLPAIQDAKGDVEGLGVVLIEAILQGCPVIASDSGGIRDIVIDGESGMLTPPGDPIALARAIRRLRTDPALRTRLLKGGRAHVERRFSWDRIVGQLVELYADVIGPDGNGRAIPGRVETE